jgi:hypothetical protein
VGKLNPTNSNLSEALFWQYPNEPRRVMQYIDDIRFRQSFIGVSCSLVLIKISFSVDIDIYNDHYLSSERLQVKVDQDDSRLVEMYAARKVKYSLIR